MTRGHVGILPALVLAAALVGCEAPPEPMDGPDAAPAEVLTWPAPGEYRLTWAHESGDAPAPAYRGLAIEPDLASFYDCAEGICLVTVNATATADGCLAIDQIPPPGRGAPIDPFVLCPDGDGGASGLVAQGSGAWLLTAQPEPER